MNEKIDMTLYKIQEILNAEGTIAAIYKDQNNTLYMQGRYNHGQVKTISKTSRFLLELYLHSRITLNYLLFHNSQIILLKKNQAIEKYIDSITEAEPPELKDITCGGALYDLLPSAMKCGLTVKEILGKLPEVTNGIIMNEIDGLELQHNFVPFFSKASPIQLVSIKSEIHNPYECDFLKVQLKTVNSYLLCKANPNLLKLLFMNHITVQDYFKAQSNNEYFYYSGKQWYKFFYSTGLEGMIENIKDGNLTYYSLKKEYQVDGVMGLWDHYTRNYLLPRGFGIVPSDFKLENPINIKLLN